MEKLIIRPAGIRDASTLISFQRQMALDTENLLLEEKVLAKGVEALLKDKFKGQYYVAEAEDEIVGCLLTTPEWSEWRNGTVLWIQSVYVVESCRNKGVFKALYNYIKNKVEKDEKLMGIRLYVDKSNMKAQEVYAKMGMDGQHYQLFEWLK